MPSVETHRYRYTKRHGNSTPHRSLEIGYAVRRLDAQAFFFLCREVLQVVPSHVIKVHMVGLPPRTEPTWQRHFDLSRQISQRPYVPPRHRPKHASRLTPQGGLDNVRVRIAPP